MLHRYQPLNARHGQTIALHANRMRHRQTPSELALWAALSSNRLGVQFRRQFVVGRFISDFAAPSCRLLVEVDGGYHEKRSRADAVRDEKLRRLGWRVLRIQAEVIMSNLAVAVAAVREAIADCR